MSASEGTGVPGAPAAAPQPFPATARVGEQIEKMVGIDFLSLFGKVTLLLGRSTVKGVSHEGWPRGGWGGCLVTNILTNPEPTFFFTFNKLAHRARIAVA